jgi:DNA-binding NtrC family response regulator
MSNANVLVVDDEDDIRALISDILSDENYGVTVAANAAEARKARAADRFDLILLDIWMPDTDGITLLREWSEAGDLNCPVVVMSGHGTVDTAVEATRLGAFDFVEKPCPSPSCCARWRRRWNPPQPSSRKAARPCRRHWRRWAAASRCANCATRHNSMPATTHPC